jgi:hypothetical protein
MAKYSREIQTILIWLIGKTLYMLVLKYQGVVLGKVDFLQWARKVACGTNPNTLFLKEIEKMTNTDYIAGAERVNKIVWYTAGGLVYKGGPYKTQVEAWAHMELTDEEQKKQHSIHPKDTRVWPEYENESTMKIRVPCGYCEFAVVGTSEQCTKELAFHYKDVHRHG